MSNNKRFLVFLFCLVIWLFACPRQGACQAIRVTSIKPEVKNSDYYFVITFASQTRIPNLETATVSTTLRYLAQPRTDDFDHLVKTNAKGTVAAFTLQAATHTDTTFVLTNLDGRGLYACTRFNDVVAELCKKVHHPVVPYDMLVQNVSGDVITLAGFIPDNTPYGIPCTIKVRAVSTGVFKVISVR